MFPRLSFRTEEDGEVALTPRGWTQRFYKLNEGPLRYSKWILELSEQLFIEAPTLSEGRLRINGRIDKNRLLIGILSKREDYRIMSSKRSGDAVTISYDESDWDIVADATGTAITLHAGPDVADMILGADSKEFLKASIKANGKNQSLLLPVIEEALVLGDMMLRFIGLAKDTAYFDQGLDRLEFVMESLISQSSRLIARYTEHDTVYDKIEKEFRVKIAKEIEAILWRDIEDLGDIQPTLSGFADYFRVSKRTIQMAIEEVFDMTFTSFRNSIRLYQARDMLREKPYHGAISEVAIVNGFEHQGRFSQQYKKLFGVLPSHDAKSKRDR